MSVKVASLIYTQTSFYIFKTRLPFLTEKALKIKNYNTFY